MNDLPVLSFKNITAHYGSIEALSNVSLEIYEGEIVTLIGANGAGKTTLMMSLFQNPKISQGEILLSGKPVHHLEPHHIIRHGIALSPEGRRVFPKLTIAENLLLGAYTVSDHLQIQEQLQKVYDLFPILAKRSAQKAGTLSGGEQQMLAIGRGLMSCPKIFCLDEPSLGLAPKLVHQIFTILKEIATLGTTIFLVEQNAHHALRLADRGYVLVNGKIEMTGTGEALLNNPSIQAAYLGGN